MPAQRLVLVDTCIWAQFFNRPQSPAKRAVDDLIDEDRAALVGPILFEVLLGFRREEQANWAASMLQGVHYVDVRWDDWLDAARLGRRLIANGHQLPLSDLVVTVVALTRKAEVYSTDPHFDLIHGLKRYSG